MKKQMIFMFLCVSTGLLGCSHLPKAQFSLGTFYAGVDIQELHDNYFKQESEGTDSDNDSKQSVK